MENLVRTDRMRTTKALKEKGVRNLTAPHRKERDKLLILRAPEGVRTPVTTIKSRVPNHQATGASGNVLLDLIPCYFPRGEYYIGSKQNFETACLCAIAEVAVCVPLCDELCPSLRTFFKSYHSLNHFVFPFLCLVRVIEKSLNCISLCSFTIVALSSPLVKRYS